MITADVQQFVREQIAGEVSFRDLGTSLGVALPLTFGDGDACEMFLSRQEDGKWLISDEGYILAIAQMQGVNLLSAGYKARFRQLAGFFGAEERDGEVRLVAESGSLGDALFVFSQACLEMARLSESPPDAKRKRRAFVKRFTKIVGSAIPKGMLEQNWFDAESDPKGIYRADYRAKDWLIYGAGSPSKTWKSAAAVQHIRNAKRQLQSVFVFSDSTEHDAKAMAAMSDNATETFSIDRQKDDLVAFLQSIATTAA